MQKPSNIGGQAVLEGIMMRHEKDYAIAVRKSDGDIVIKKDIYKTTIPIEGIEKIPVLRGVSAFLDSLVVGVSCLMYSADYFDEEETDTQRAAKDAEIVREEYLKESEKLHESAAREKQRAGNGEKSAQEQAECGGGKIVADDGTKKGLSKAETTLTVVFAAALSIGLFMLLPYGLASILRRFGASEVVISLTEAVLRILIFLGYMLLVSQMKDIQRVFMYHGSEHKCINCIEHGHPLTVENVLKSSRMHKRCGTSFMLIVIILSVIVFLVIGLMGITSPFARLGLRLLFIPIIAGVSYEFIRLAGRSENPCIVALSKPGMLLQKLVTKEPDAAQVEVAIAAVEAVFDWKAYLAENFPEGEAKI